MRRVLTKADESPELDSCQGPLFRTLDRISRVGECHRQAARRRAWLKREEERMQEERSYANVRTRGLTRGQLAIL